MTNSYNPYQEKLDSQLEEELLMHEQIAEEEEAALEQYNEVSQVAPQAVGKEGPSFIPGASEEAAAELEAAEEEGPIPTNPIEAVAQSTATFGQAIGQGLGDTAVGLAKNIAGIAASSSAGWDELAEGQVAPNYAQQGTEALHDFWHKHNPQSDNGAAHAVRQISGVVLPSIIAPQAIIPRVAALPWAAKLPAVAKTTGAIAARLGIDTTIVAASSSATDDNAAKALNDALGWNLPWATEEGASPDAKRKYQLYENMGFGVAGELLQGVFALRSYLKARPKRNTFAASWIHNYDVERFEVARSGAKVDSLIEWDPGLVVRPTTEETAAQLTRNADAIAAQSRSPAIKEIDDAIEKLGGLGDELTEQGENALAELVELRKRTEVDELPTDSLTRYVDEGVKTRSNALATEAEEIAPLNQGEYNPILHEPAEAQARAQPISGPADPLGAGYDHVRIQKSIDTAYGRARAVLPTDGMRKFFNAALGTDRGNILDEVVAAFTPGKEMEAMIEGKWRSSPEDYKAAIDQVSKDIHNLDPKVFAEQLNSLKTKALKGVDVLPTEDFLVYSSALKEVFRSLDPDQLRASALVVRQAADSVESAAKAANILDGVLDTTRQQHNLYDNLGIVAKETRAVRYLWGYTGRLIDMANNRRFNPQELMDLVDGFDQGLADATSSATKFVDEMKRIATEDPEYLKAFTKAYDLTEGKVDDILKLQRWAEEKVSLSKLIFNKNTNVKSLIVQGIHGIRYNSMLNGLAPVRAFAGNTLLTVGKPISVLAGSAFQAVTGNPGQAAVLKRALYTYGGVAENFQRALKHMGKEWSFAVANPEQAMIRGRADVKFSNSDDFEVMEAVAEGWRHEGKHGNLALLNMAKLTSWYNNLSLNRWGINALHSIDGFTNSMMASGVARAKAYDELLDSTGGLIKQADFEKLQQKLYSQSFDETGLLTDTAAKHASQEIALNLDSATAKMVEEAMDKVPVLKPLFMFPRTGVNGFKVAWSYNPLSALPDALGKGNKVFNARTKAEILDVLRTHGITDFSDPLVALDALKAEYRGRQVMGSAVVMGAGLLAVNGNLTGNGPWQAEEKNDMMRLGWKPNSIRINGTWYSYKGLEPYQQILSLTADAIYNSDRVDSAITEDWLQKIGFAMSMNVTNQTFLSGMAPLVGIINRDQTQVQRFLAGWVDPGVYFTWSGTRSILNKAISPQLKDVENDMLSYLKNSNKYLFSDNANLKDQLDVYTGQRINYFEPMTAAINSVLPFFKSNGGQEPWRQWLIGTGWNNLQTLRTNRLTDQPLSTEDRYFINNWVAKHAGLRRQIETLMEEDRKGKYTNRYVNARGQQKQKEFPISDTYIHDKLDAMHTAAFKAAWKALSMENTSYRSLDLLEARKKEMLERGMVSGASSVQNQIDSILKN